MIFPYFFWIPTKLKNCRHLQLYFFLQIPFLGFLGLFLLFFSLFILCKTCLMHSTLKVFLFHKKKHSSNNFCYLLVIHLLMSEFCCFMITKLCPRKWKSSLENQPSEMPAGNIPWTSSVKMRMKHGVQVIYRNTGIYAIWWLAA